MTSHPFSIRFFFSLALLGVFTFSSSLVQASLESSTEEREFTNVLKSLSSTITPMNQQPTVGKEKVLNPIPRSAVAPVNIPDPTTPVRRRKILTHYSSESHFDPLEPLYPPMIVISKAEENSSFSSVYMAIPLDSSCFQPTLASLTETPPRRPTIHINKLYKRTCEKSGPMKYGVQKEYPPFSLYRDEERSIVPFKNPAANNQELTSRLYRTLLHQTIATTIEEWDDFLFGPLFQNYNTEQIVQGIWQEATLFFSELFQEYRLLKEEESTLQGSEVSLSYRFSSAEETAQYLFDVNKDRARGRDDSKSWEEVLPAIYAAAASNQATITAQKLLHLWYEEALSRKENGETLAHVYHSAFSMTGGNFLRNLMWTNLQSMYEISPSMNRTKALCFLPSKFPLVNSLHSVL